jgi:hypothetical protein
MKKFLIAGTSLAAVAAAGSAGAVDVTLGGSINMGIDFGLGKNNANPLVIGEAFNEVSLSIKAAHTTDGGLAFGGGFTMGAATELEFAPYTDGGAKFAARMTVDGRTNIAANLWNVSGGGAVAADNVVSVKINSDWLGIDQQQEAFTLALGSFTSSNICKLAGRGGVYDGGTTYGGLYTADPSGRYVGNTSTAAQITDADDLGLESADDEYLPAGQFFQVNSTTVNAASPIKTNQNTFDADYNYLSTTRGAFAAITAGGGTAGIDPEANTKTLTATYAGAASGDTATVVIEAYSKAAVDVDGDDSYDVASAAVFAGPFMEVMMASSETKMVVGAACLEGNDSSATAFFLNNASDVMTVSNASIYIDGGFGRLTLQSGDYAGGVSAIAGAGDAADIDAGGLVVIAQGLGILGANPYIAVDLNKGDTLGALEVITGGTIDLGGLSASIDVALDNPEDVFGVSAWDLGATYALGDLGLAFATDSSSDWGLRASMAIAGFNVSTTFGSSTAADHTKAGITYSVSASTALNGFGLALGFDQDLQPTVGVNYDLGGLVLSAGYDAGDQGGSLGATLSF